MSIPPQLIRVKRKRVEETPVTFLQFDQDSSKRRRGGSNWAYQRRRGVSQQPGKATQPIIHVSSSHPGTKEDVAQPSSNHDGPRPVAPGSSEPRKFRVSRGSMAKNGRSGPHRDAVSKQTRFSAAVFVEATGRKKASKTRKHSLANHHVAQRLLSRQESDESSAKSNVVVAEKLKRPGVARKAHTASPQQAPVRAPLPESLMHRQNHDMEKITNDMNEWVLNELGANLQSMQQEKQRTPLKPKSPAKRFHERHPEFAPPPSPAAAQVDVVMSDLSDDYGEEEEEEDEGEWIIEEYVRIPANSVALDVPASDVGILVLDEDEENLLFFGSPNDDDDELAEDDEDENAENHYTADYPEDEVDSDDEYGRHAYLYRQGNNSDDEENDEDYEEQDEIVFEGNDDDNDDDDVARMARMRQFMKRSSAFQ